MIIKDGAVMFSPARERSTLGKCTLLLLHRSYCVAADRPLRCDRKFPAAGDGDGVGRRPSAGVHDYVPQRRVAGPRRAERQALLHRGPAENTYTCTDA